MTAIWRNDGGSWRVLAPTGFPAEAALHTLVEQAPQMLPLAGSPQLVVLGKEVLLGNGSADLIAVEPNGRLVVIEVKLRRNAEARRAVVAQTLTYAAYLRGVDVETLEHVILAKHLRERGYDSLAHAVSTNDQEGSFDAANFAAGVTASLASGHFRLVLVLDEAPDELVRLVGYLESVTDKLLIDLITVAAYEVDGSQILVPQRLEADMPPARPADGTTIGRSSAAQGNLTEGAEAFVASISQAPESERPILQQLVEWALALEAEKLVTLQTYAGVSNRWTLLPRLRAENVGLVTIWNENGAYLSLYRSVFERRAPASLPRIEGLIAPDRVGKGTVTRRITSELLDALTEAYREAAS